MVIKFEATNQTKKQKDKTPGQKIYNFAPFLDF